MKPSGGDVLDHETDFIHVRSKHHPGPVLPLPVKLGGGPTIVVYDARMLPNLRLRALAVEPAHSMGIPVQFS